MTTTPPDPRATLVHLATNRYGIDYPACWPPEQDAHPPAWQLRYNRSEVTCPACLLT